MLTIDQAKLDDPRRTAAVDRCRHLPPGPVTLDACARLAARLLDAPMASITLVGGKEEFSTGLFGLLGLGRSRTLKYSVCKYVVGADHVTSCDDMTVDDDPQWCEHLLVQQHGVRSFLSVPVRDHDDQFVGSLTVLDTRARAWTGENIATLLEIERSLPYSCSPEAFDLEESEIKRVERFRDCHLDVDQALNNAPSIEEAAPTVLRHLVRTLGWPAAELFLLDEVGGDLRAAGHWSAWDTEPDGFFDHAPVKGAGVTGRAWQTGQPVWAPEILKINYLRTPFELARVAACTAGGIHSVLAVPVRDGDTVLGVLTCYAGAGENNQDMLTVLLDGVAAQIGAYIAQRRADQTSRQLVRAQDDLIALVGHELRTPITSIASLAALLVEDSTMPGADRQMIDSILRNAMSLQRMIDTLLELAGLDAGHLHLNTAHTDLAVILTQAVRAARHGAADHGVHLRYAPTEQVALTADPHRLRQVVDDLLSNAINYSPSGGNVTVTARDDDGVVRLAISDEGIGTPADEHDRVFDRFFRGSNVRHHGTPGSGLGLSLARTIVRLHAGTIELTDNQPRGTTVSIALPR